MKEYIGRDWESILQQNKLGSFDAIWSLDAGWFEEPNKRRGGWSGVSRIRLDTKDGGSIGVFLKRQENHNTKSLASPVKGVPTFYREFKNISRFIAKGIPTVEPIYFSYRYVNGNSQAILMSKELEGYNSLDASIYLREGTLMKNKVHREQLMIAIANAMRKMHKHHFRHNCLYSKHIFVRQVEHVWDVKFIDLEKLRWGFFKENACFRDLYTLSRRIVGWRRNDRLKFFQLYRQENKLSAKSKSLWRRIDHKIKAKGLSLDNSSLEH